MPFKKKHDKFLKLRFVVGESNIDQVLNLNYIGLGSVA